MGSVIDPALLTESGERCIHRLAELGELRLPSAQLITALGTAVEVHVSRILVRLIVLSDVQESDLGSVMLTELEREMTRSWSSRSSWLKRGFAVEYEGEPQSQAFQSLVELRNSVVHGDGAASDEQERKGTSKLKELRKAFARYLDVEFYGQARFSASTPALAMDIARNFVAHFDARVLARYPRVKGL